VTQSRAESRAQSRAAASRASNRRLFVILAICVVVAIIVLVVGILVTKSASYTAAETRVLGSIAASRVPTIVSISLGFNWFFSPPIAVITSVVTAGIVFAITRRWVTVLHFGALVLGTWLSSEVIKVIVHRPRPAGHIADVLVPNPDPDSYPSGHVCFAVGFTFAILILVWNTRAKWIVVVLAVLLSLATAVSRIYLGIHYPTDVVASLVFAAAAFIAIEALWRRFVSPVRAEIRAGAQPQPAS
jgi:membrane-associated phospholipid phosphatase